MFLKPLIAGLSVLLLAISGKAQSNENYAFSSATKFENFFIENKGQLGQVNDTNQINALFELNAPGVKIYLTNRGLSYFLYEVNEFDEGCSETGGRENEKIKWERIDLDLLGAKIESKDIITLFPGNNGVFNFFNPNVPDGILNIKEYRKLIVPNVYPFIDWEIYISDHYGLKYDFIMHSGANPSDILMAYNSINSAQLLNGNILISTSYGDFIDAAPMSFLNDKIIESNYKFVSVKNNFVNGKTTTFGINLPENISNTIQNNDLNEIIIIDPVVTWSTFYGGELAEGGTCIATDSKQNVYVGGYRRSMTCPLYDNGVSYFQGAFTESWGALILKFDNNGQRLWVTNYDGSGSEEIRDVAIDQNDNVFFVGYTSSSDFPVKDNGGFYQTYNSLTSDTGFIMEFNEDGERKWATHYGAPVGLVVNSVEIDVNNNLIVAGLSTSPGVPFFDAGSFYMESVVGSQQDAFISKFDQNKNLTWSTAIGGSRNDNSLGIATDSQGNIYITGNTQSDEFPILDDSGFFDGVLSNNVDSYLNKFDSSGNLIWGTFFGGNDQDWGLDVFVDQQDFIYISGLTNSTDLPVTNGSIHAGEIDLYFFKFSPNGAIDWGTYIGGPYNEYASNTNPIISKQKYFQSNMITSDSCGNVYLGFETESYNIATKKFCENCHHVAQSAGERNQFLCAFSAEGILRGATYIGGNGRNFRCAITLDKSENLWMTGEWSHVIDESSFPVVEGPAGSYNDASFNGIPDDVFLMKMKMNKDFNCNSEVSVPVPFILVMPNVFTPNQNGVNEFFQPINAQGFHLTTWQIINRWGNVVFESNDLGAKWNGLDQKGNQVTDGTYFWIIRGVDVEDNKVLRHGTVDIRR